eukprot:1180760-Prorocentrum_minimum.AAC.2
MLEGRVWMLKQPEPAGALRPVSSERTHKPGAPEAQRTPSCSDRVQTPSGRPPDPLRTRSGPPPDTLRTPSSGPLCLRAPSPRLAALNSLRGLISKHGALRCSSRIQAAPQRYGAL